MSQFHLGKSQDIPLGQGSCFIVQGIEIAVFRTRDGRVLAIENKCPHRQGPLSEGIVGDGKVVCPLHGHKFDLTTGQGSEKHECVRTFPLRKVEGEMVLDVPTDYLKAKNRNECALH